MMPLQNTQTNTALQFTAFVALKFQSNRYSSNYRNFEEFKKYYILSEGLDEWLASLRNLDIPLTLVNNIVRNYIIYVKRSPADIPMILCCLCNMYSMRMPAIAGLFTREYWQEKCVSLGMV